MLEDDILKSLEEEPKEEVSNEIVELEDTKDNIYDLNNKDEKDKVKIKKNKKKKHHGWNDLTKKQRTIILVCLFVFLILIIGILLFLLLNKDNAISNDNTPKKDPVVVNKDNYSYIDGKLIFQDVNKNNVGEYACQNKDDDLCYIAYYSNEDNFDTTKYVYENGLDANIQSDILKNRYVLIYDNPSTTEENIILYDIKESKDLGHYKLAKELNNSSFILKDENDLYGVLTFNDEVKESIPFSYAYIGYILNSDSLIVKDTDGYYLTDFNGQKLTKAFAGEIKAFDSKFVSSLIDGNRILYNYNAERVTATDYDYLAFQDSYVIAIVNRKLKVYDKNMNAMHYEELKLSTNKYNTVVTLNEDNEEISRTDAYTIAIGNGKIEIDYLDNKKENQRATLNLYEGLISSKMDYISYYDGKLYIFKDEDKTSLIGSYTCENPNQVDEDTTILSNCFLAFETKIADKKAEGEVGYLPIYNNRYAFIQDGDVINFWDLNTNTRKATYKEADAGFYNNISIVNFVKANDNLIIAKNTSDKYGAIKISTSGSLERVIDFENTEISKANDQYLFKNENNVYGLYNPKTNTITKDIIDYNGSYLVSLKDNKASIYTLDGKIVVTSSSLAYAKLYDKFFVGIDAFKQINVYKYDGTVVSGSYGNYALVSDYANAFSVDIDGNIIKVNILNSNKEISSSFTVTMY